MFEFIIFNPFLIHYILTGLTELPPLNTILVYDSQKELKEKKTKSNNINKITYVLTGFLRFQAEWLEMLQPEATIGVLQPPASCS